MLNDSWNLAIFDGLGVLWRGFLYRNTHAPCARLDLDKTTFCVFHLGCRKGMVFRWSKHLWLNTHTWFRFKMIQDYVNENGWLCDVTYTENQWDTSWRHDRANKPVPRSIACHLPRWSNTLICHVSHNLPRIDSCFHQDANGSYDSSASGLYWVEMLFPIL